MHVAVPGVMELVLLLTMGGGLGVPLGIPPAPEDPLMANVAPEQCLFYVTWSGMAKPDANSPNQTEQLLAEPEVQHMIAEIERCITASLKEAASREGPEAAATATEAVKWVKTLLTSPTAAFVSDVQLTQTGPSIQGGALVRVGDDVKKLKAWLQQLQAKGGLPVQQVEIADITWDRFQPERNAPVITWGVKGKYLIVGIGEGSVEGIIERARTPKPQWLADVRKQLAVDRTATVTYVNVKKAVATATPFAGGSPLGVILQATGLDNVTSLASVTGLDKTGFVNRTLLSIEGEPQGLLSLVPTKPLGAEDLAPIPSDATLAVAARIDAEAVFQTILSTIEAIEPRAREQLLKEIGEMEAGLGIKLQDVLESLGDAWCIYNSPSEGGLVITGLTAVVPVEDRAKLAAAHDRLIAMAKAQMEQEARGRRGPRIEQFRFAGQEVYFFNARDDEFPLAPAWCLTDDALVIAPVPQNIKAYLSRTGPVKSLAEVPEVARQLGAADGPVVLKYFDVPKLFELIYPFAPFFAQVVMSEMQREGIDVNVSILPSAPAIGPHLRPAVIVVRRTPAGIEVTSRQTLPGGSIGTSLPATLGLMAPAVISARAAARRAASVNNLRQIGLSLHIYHEASKSFPPAYTTDQSGKPLLSWRVQILPYIEEKPLYDRFHLDEPWDSQHNRQLIPLMPRVFKAPGSKCGPGKTNYLAVSGRQTVFPGKEAISIRDIRDGSSDTMMVVEVNDAKAVEWTRPDDFPYDQPNPIAGLVGLRPGGFNALFCDGSVRFISATINPQTLKALFTRDGGETIDPGSYY